YAALSNASGGVHPSNHVVGDEPMRGGNPHASRAPLEPPLFETAPERLAVACLDALPDRYGVVGGMQATGEPQTQHHDLTRLRLRRLVLRLGFRRCAALQRSRPEVA